MMYTINIPKRIPDRIMWLWYTDNIGVNLKYSYNISFSLDYKIDRHYVASTSNYGEYVYYTKFFNDPSKYQYLSKSKFRINNNTFSRSEIHDIKPTLLKLLGDEFENWHVYYKSSDPIVTRHLSFKNKEYYMYYKMTI